MFKTVSLTLAAIVASATIASADANYINTLAQVQDSESRIELGLVRAEADGVVEIHSYHGGSVGKLLGSTDVHAGTNINVDVNSLVNGTDAIAILKVNGQIVDTQEIEFK